MSRFAPFTDDELTELWDGLVMDDGVRYGFEDDNHDVDAELARELHAEATRRGLATPGSIRWDNVVT